MIEVLDPASGRTIATVEEDTPDSVAATAKKLRENQAVWERIGIAERRRWLDLLRDWLLDNETQIADLMQAETGKVRADANAETHYLTDLIGYYGSRAEEFLADEKLRPHSPLMAGKKLVVQYRPYPLVGIISPWNFPLILSLGDAIPALQAGAAVAIKPSELTPLTLAEIARAWREEIGAPDVFEVVQGGGETGEALIDECDFIQFTGSDRTGKKVMARAAETLTPVSLELGGKDPMIVLEGADVERAARAASWGGMVNSGQVCMSVERIYVEEPIYDQFVTRLNEEISGLRQGSDGRSYSCDIGAMTSPEQSGIVESQLEEAVGAGATILTGGSRREGDGDYFEPTVVVDVDHSMRLMRDESFGPVVGVMRVKDPEEAVRLANDSRYGLSASVFGRRKEAEMIARRVECGAVNVNDVMVNYLTSDVPMGGWKESGIGSRHGLGGMRKYCRSESLVISTMPRKREPLWFPYSRRRRKLVERAARLVSGRGLARRLGLPARWRRGA